MRKLLISLTCLAILLLCVVFLFNLPAIHTIEGLPLFPAILAAETTLLAGAMCLYALYRFVLKDLRATARSRALPKDQPWLVNPDWAKGQMKYSAGAPALILWFFALNWWGAIWFFYVDRGEEIIAEGGAVLLLCGFFIFLGAITLWVAVRKTQQWLRYGKSVLTIETLPARPGKVFRAAIRTPFSQKPEKSLRLTMTGFERHWTTRSGDSQSQLHTRHDIQDQPPFHEERKKLSPAKLALVDGQITVPVNFEIPADAASSGPQTATSEVVWKLHIREVSRGAAEYEAEFEIPVFAN